MRIKATLRTEAGCFETDIELIGYPQAPQNLTLNIEGFSGSYRLDAEDIRHERAHYVAEK